MPISEEAYKAILDSGLKHVERIRAANRWEHGILVVPFVCYGCSEKRTDFCMTTGDGVPMCSRCFDGFVAAISKNNQNTP